MDLMQIISSIKATDSKGYDIVTHIDGSKEDLARLFILRKIFDLKVLTVTFNNHQFTNSQKRNIKLALEVLNVDNILLTPRVAILDKLASLFPREIRLLFRQGEDALLVRMASRYKVTYIACSPNSLLPSFYSLNESPCCSRLLEQTGLDLIEMAHGKFKMSDLIPYRLPERRSRDLSEIKVIQLSKNIDYSPKGIQDFLGKFNWTDETVEGSKKIWLGYPDDWRDFVAKSMLEARHNTKYEELARSSKAGFPLFENEIDYCKRCCMPVTAEGLELDELGMCQPCRSSEQKMHIDWRSRQEKLGLILDRYSQSQNYDCMVPISGGKDSTFQLYMIKSVYKKEALAVTFSHNWLSDTGRENLLNAIEQFDVDHLMFTPNRDSVQKLARKSLFMIGDPCWHCHAGVGAFPLQMAVAYGIKLLIWGESVAECDGRATYEKPIVFDRDYFTKISARYFAEEMIDKDIGCFDILPYKLPSYEEIRLAEVSGIHLGDYIFWDDERQMEFVRNNFGWKEHEVEGAYKGYKSVECVMAGIHDYTKFIKRGFGRGTDQASQDVRNGLLTREEGFDLAKKYDTQRPPTLDYYLSMTGLTEDDMEKVLKANRDQKARKIP